MHNVLKPLSLSALGLAALLVGGAAFGQTVEDATSHGVTINIPEVVEIRIVNGTSNAEVTNPFVAFDYSATADYFAAVAAGTMASTDTNFSDIRVFVNRSTTWTVSVQANELADAGGTAPGGLSVTDISVSPSVIAGYSLSTTSTQIASGTQTTGFESLGIAGTDYSVAIQGDETPGDYSTVVTYTLSSP